MTMRRRLRLPAVARCELPYVADPVVIAILPNKSTDVRPTQICAGRDDRAPPLHSISALPSILTRLAHAKGAVSGECIRHSSRAWLRAHRPPTASHSAPARRWNAGSTFRGYVAG